MAEPNSELVNEKVPLLTETVFGLLTLTQHGQ